MDRPQQKQVEMVHYITVDEREGFPCKSKTNAHSFFMAILKAILKALFGSKTPEKLSSYVSFYEEFEDALNNRHGIVNGRAKRLKHKFVTKAKPLIEAYYRLVQSAASPRYDKEVLQQLKKKLNTLKEEADSKSQLFFLFSCQARVKSFFKQSATLLQQMSDNVEQAIQLIKQVKPSYECDNKGEEEDNFTENKQDLKYMKNKLKLLDVQHEHLERDSKRLKKDTARIKKANELANEALKQMRKSYILLEAMVRNDKLERKSPSYSFYFSYYKKGIR